MQAQKRQQLTPQEYLIQERLAESKSEYVHGELWAMSGARHAHNKVAAALLAALYDCVKKKGCTIVGSDQRVFIPRTQSYFYPDLVIVCGKPLFQDEELDTLLNPQVVVEILSPSTANWDRGGKFKLYRDLDTLLQYVLIDPDARAFEVWEKTVNWALTQEGTAGSLTIAGCEIQVDEMFAD